MAEDPAAPTTPTASASDASAATPSNDQHTDTPTPNKVMTEEELAAISGGDIGSDYYSDDTSQYFSSWFVSGDGSDPDDFALS